MIFLVLLAIPLVVAIVGFIALKGVTWKEFACQCVAQVFIAFISAMLVAWSNTSDTEIWNGWVTKKNSERVTCSHTYPCNCHTVCSGSGKNRSCSEECDTCRYHSYDVDWEVHSSNGEEWDIDRVDWQGVNEPARFTAVRVGEPTSSTHSYTNYVKAAPDTLFRHQGLKEKYAQQVPKYPDRIYDYYRLDRLVTVGVSVPNAQDWNTSLAELNGELGKKKQVNMIVLLVTGLPQEYYFAVEETWIGGNKNDVVLVIDVDGDMKPQWASVMAWSNNKLFQVKLRDDIMDDPAVTKDSVLAALKTNVTTYFDRKPMHDFKYLEASIVPSTLEWVISLIIGLLVAGGLTYVFETQDVFGDE